MSEEIKVYPSGEQAAKLEGIENAVEKNLSKDEIERQKEIAATTKTAKEALDWIKKGGLSLSLKLSEETNNPQLKKLYSSPFMRRAINGGLVAAGTAGVIVGAATYAELVVAGGLVAAAGVVDGYVSLRKTNMAKCFGYALKNSVKNTINTVKNIKRAKNIAAAKKRSEEALARKNEPKLEVVYGYENFKKEQKRKNHPVNKLIEMVKSKVGGRK